MTTDDFEDFRDGISGVMSFYGKGVSDFALDVWWAALKAFDLAAIREAFNRHLMSPDAGQFPPKPADIVRMLGGRSEDRALSAWAKVDRAVRSVGSYQSVAFDDPLIHRVLHDMGGWIALGQKTEDEWPFVAKEFENRYRGFAMRGETPDYPRALTGIAEAYNGAKGLRTDPPRLIGDPQAAQRVMSGGTTSPLVQVSQAGSLAAGASLRAIEGGKQSA